ncbi:MAG: type IX secretion system protein PorQ [Rubricoccaceae bacterium]|nr:type IX secretion system protein PorQ [Rubricoccaceae bacterium]
MRSPVVFLFCFLFVSSAAAQTSRETGFDLLRLHPSARAAALSGAVGSVPSDDPSMALYNPALLTDGMHRGLSVTYLNHLADINAGFVSYARTVGSAGTIAAGIRYLSYGSFERADENGVRDGTTFGAGEAAVSVTYAHQFTSRIRGGATLHAAMASIDDARAQALAADVGVHYSVPESAFGASLSIHHLGFVMSHLGETNDSLPLDIRLGVSKKLGHLPLTVMLMGYNLHDYSGDGSALDQAARHVNAGIEVHVADPVDIRLGYNPRTHQELATGDRLDLAGLSAGFGINLSRVQFDYAFNSWSELGGLHQLSVRTRI